MRPAQPKLPTKADLIRELRKLGVTHVTRRAAQLAHLRVLLAEAVDACEELTLAGADGFEIPRVALDAWRVHVDDLVTAEVRR